jgi:hypothetical protein
MNALDLLTRTPEGDFKPKIDKGFVGLFVGHSGCGKDCAEASFAKLGKMYVFDVDNRIRGLLASSSWLGVDIIKNIDFDFYNPRDGFKAIDDKLDKFLALAISRNLEYKTICINSTSSLVYSLAIESRRARGEKGRTLAGLKFTDPGDYNFMSMAMRQIQFLYAMPLAELGVNIIFSGHLVDRWEKPKIDREQGITEYSPAVVTGHKLLGPDKLAEELPGYFDEVYLFKKEAITTLNTTYKVQFSGQFAKTTLPISGKELDLTNKSFYDEWKKLVESQVYLTKKG